MNNSCSFCESETIAKQEIAIIGSIRILYPRRPIIAANVLITPVRCIEHIHDLTEEEVGDMFSVVKKLHQAFQSIYSTTGYNFFANDGRAAGQHVPHVHFHFYGRSENEEINPFEVLNDKEKYLNRLQMQDEDYIRNINQIKMTIEEMFKA
jgi:diadenosine tetraphosphate (Ap4A) HIT family hydrolase